MGKFLDAAFRKFKRRESEADKEEFVNMLADAIATRTFGTSLSDKERAEIEEYERLAAEGRRIRRERIASMGVDTALFTEEKVIADALALVDEFVPDARNMNLSLANGRASVNFQNLTKTGKLPKNVASAQYICDSPSESLIVNIKYLQDGSVNMADMNAWRSRGGLLISIRYVDGAHRITYVTKLDVATDVRETLYSYEASKKKALNMAAMFAELDEI